MDATFPDHQPQKGRKTIQLGTLMASAIMYSMKRITDTG
jgi:hypothetical protein